jgi:hypothetical protein
MLSDDDLTRLLGEAAGGYAVPELELPARPRPQRWRGRAVQLSAAAAALVAGALLVQGGLPQLGSGSSNEKTSAQVQRNRLSDGATGQTGGVGVPGASRVPALPGAPVPEALTPATGELTSGAGTQADAVGASAQDAARVVKTGTLALVVDHGKVSATVQRLQQLVAGVQGYVSDSTTAEAGDHPSATVTVRVPVARFEALVQQVRALKVTVVSAQTSGKDVTATYADTQAQIQSLQAARARYLAILAGAKTIAETLTVQQRVDDVQGQIDRLEGQRRVLADQSDLATLTVTVGEQGDQVLTTSPRTGWSKAWHDAWHGFTGGLQSMLGGSGRALLVVLVGAVVLLLGRWGWRFARRRLV